jgi:hypothetical protein
MKLTNQQKYGLILVAEGKTIYPHLLKRTIPSLVKKGLISKKVPITGIDIQPGWWTYRLTKDGYDIYESLRIKKYHKNIKELDEEFHKNIKTATNRTID